MSHPPQVNALKLSILVLSACVALGDGSAADDVSNNGEDFTRPPAQYDFRYRFDEKSGDISTDTFILRVNRPFSLGDGWKIGTRLDLPFVLTDKPSKDNPSGKDTFGLGDVLLQAVLIDEFSKRWAAGLGPRLVLPTASQDQFGTGRIQLGPIGGARYSLPEISDGSFAQLVARYDCDIAGQRGRSHISRLRWSPTLNINLTRDWFITFFPSQEIAVNFLDGGKWFFPFDFLVGKRLSSRVLVSVETSVPLVRDYNLYEFRLQTRLSFAF